MGQGFSEVDLPMECYGAVSFLLLTVMQMRQIASAMIAVFFGTVLAVAAICFIVSVLKRRRYEHDSLPSLEALGLEDSEIIEDDDDLESGASVFSLEDAEKTELTDDSSAMILAEAQRENTEVEPVKTRMQRRRSLRRR